MNLKIAPCSVLLPTYDRADMVARCMLYVAKQSLSPEELIILDQGRLNKSRLFRLWRTNYSPTKLIYLRINQRGKSNALNLGVAKAHTSIIAVLDDDCFANSQWIQAMMKSINKNRMTIITGKVIAGKPKRGSVRVRDYVTKEAPITYKKGKLITPIFILSGGNFCFSLNDFYKIGPFNISFGPGSKFKSAEDVEWCYRALAKGYKVQYIPEAIVEHKSWRSKIQDLEIMEKYGYGAGAFIRLVFTESKIDFAYHTSNIFRWLSCELIKSACQFKDFRPYLSYIIYFIRGFRAKTT